MAITKPIRTDCSLIYCEAADSVQGERTQHASQAPRLPLFFFWKRQISALRAFTHGRHLAHVLSAAGQPARRSPIYVNMLDEVASKSGDGVQMLSRWRFSKPFTQVLNNKCDLRKPPTVQSYQNSSGTARWAPGLGSAVVFRSRPTGSSRYTSATVGSAPSQVRLLLFPPSTAGWRIQRTLGLRVLRSKLFTGTERRPSAVKKKKKKVGDTEQKSKKCARKANCDRPEP